MNFKKKILRKLEAFCQYNFVFPFKRFGLTVADLIKIEFKTRHIQVYITSCTFVYINNFQRGLYSQLQIEEPTPSFYPLINQS